MKNVHFINIINIFYLEYNCVFEVLIDRKSYKFGPFTIKLESVLF